MISKRRSKIIKTVVTALVLIALALFLYDKAERMVYPVEYKGYIEKYSEKYDIDPYLILAMIKVESNFNPQAVSPRNARGLMQVSDSTGKWASGKMKLENYGSDSLMDPETNISVGCWYLAYLGRVYDKKRSLMLAAYNAGTGNVSTWLKDSRFSPDGRNLVSIPFKETRNYLKKVDKCYNIYIRLYENIWR